MKRWAIAAVAALVSVSVPRAASAFCGFYVTGSDSQLLADATQVVLMRKGTRTVLSMQNNYKGPPSEFAMVIPVPVVLREGDVKTLPKAVFENVERMGAPRLVEYWEQDPCYVEEEYDMPRPTTVKMASKPSKKKAESEDLGVTVEAQFEVGEYQIVILSAKDSTGLDTWLRREKYSIPKQAEPLLRPYVENGMKFFVAKVNPKKVTFVDGRAELSPLRFHYDSDEFALPIRLGLANSGGTQDLIVSILAPNQRYEVANYKNVTIPTNLEVKDDVRDRFGEFYAALFDRTLEKNPGAVVTEYAWQATTCDPCPGPALNYQEFQTLGADVLSGSRDKPTAYSRADFVLTRLHARYGKTVTDDLRFKAAPPIVGGREFLVDGKKLEEGSRPDSTNNFQGRYAIRHRFTGKITCPNPVFGRWGGPPGQGRWAQQAPQAGTGLAFAPRGQVVLAKAVKQDVPEIDVKAVAATVASGGWGTPTGTTKPEERIDQPPPAPEKKKGCGCGAGADPTIAVGLFGLLMILRRRRS